jgi:glycerate dehydrogenase
MKAVFLDFATMGPGLDTESVRKVLPNIEFFDVTGDAQIAARIEGAEFILGNKVRITREHMESNPGLRYIGLTATGTDNIDLLAAKENDVAVCNIRAYCAESVAEHVFGCLLNLTRSLVQYNAIVRAGEWQESDDFCLMSFPIRELSSLTLGIVGNGNLGQAVARLGKAFGMNVLVSARPGMDEIADGRVAFDELLRRSDVISLHCPLNPSTAGLFGATQFAAMKSTAILVNTARGGLVNSAALVEALNKGQIAAAAIDVLPTEPPVAGDPLLDYTGPNLMITPHVAWASDKARQAALDQLAECVAAFTNGELKNRVV